MLKAIRFRVQNYRNINDSGWIPLDSVTAFVGRNESGKSALLKALHKFNPAVVEPYDPQKEFPRDRYSRDFKDPADWPVCSIAFEFTDDLRSELEKLLPNSANFKEVVCTRFYDGNLKIDFDPVAIAELLSPAPAIAGLQAFAAAARRLQPPTPEQEEPTQQVRTTLATWAASWEEKLAAHDDLRGEEGANLLSTLKRESESHSKPQTAESVEALQAVITPMLQSAQKPAPTEEACSLIKNHLPAFIYFDNIGALDSAIYLPRFLDDLKRTPDDPKIRTVNAMFKHVNVTAQEIAELGREQARGPNQPPTPETIAKDQQKKEARAIKLNSASLDITKRFNEWYGQRRHTIDYQADGDYFRIWVADDRRPGVRIELESRSKGFQWFFSFYLVFLVESDEGHKDAVLLLDEPALHLHPTAQQELITFFERLSENNQLIYTTHSPFLIDGENLQRVRPVTEDAAGHSHITAESWPTDHETIFPLQAAAGYAMVRGLFQHKNNVLVEGMSDYYYLHALSARCQCSGKEALRDEIYITPCGGTKFVGHIASLFLGQKVRPLVLLDGDDAGKARQDALLKELYASHSSAILMLDDALGRPGVSTEIEDMLGEDVVLPAVSAVFGQNVTLSDADRAAGSLPSQIKAWAARNGFELPVGWKATTAIYLVTLWAKDASRLNDAVLDRAKTLFAAINQRFPSPSGG
jgi:energy-coupling factor transporter ATP-binding protein EcfA2